MHNLTKIKIFRTLLWITYPISVVFLYPISLLRKKRKSALFFFFDRYSIGGAQKVYLDILESVEDIQKEVYFTRYSQNDKLKNEFYSLPKTECNDIHFLCDYLIFRVFSVHYYSFLMNRQKSSKILSSNSTFFYDMLPFLNNKIIKLELLHNFSYGEKGMEYFGLANHKYLDKRIVIDAATKENIIHQYSEYDIAEKYKERVMLIEFGVTVPIYSEKTVPPPIKILYAGRGTTQKRIWLLNRVVEFFIPGNEIEFLFAGSMADELSEKVKSTCKVYGEIGDKQAMNQLFADCHAIILTSSFEGFPVVVKEAMAHGCVPIVPALEGIKTHLRHLENALLIECPENENLVVINAINNINLLLTDPQLLQHLSNKAYNYALNNFRKDNFMLKYQQLLC